MRLFFAVELPEEVRRSIATGLGELRRMMPAARWVRPEALHVTLKFLGEQPESLLEPLGRDAQTSLRDVSQVTVALDGGGFFPSTRRPRVAWLGGRADGLDAWAERLERCARRHGVAEEGRGFSLHLTLARLDQPWSEESVGAFLRAVGGWRLRPFVAREIVLFRSELAPGGARHTALRRFEVEPRGTQGGGGGA